MILVTGATGLVGTHLLVHLVKSGQSVRAVYRTAAKKEQARKVFTSYIEEGESTSFDAIDWHQGTITDIPFLTTVFEGITNVYHCAAFISFDPKEYKTLRKVNIEGTANIVNLCLIHGVRKLCYVSSIATLSELPVKNYVIDETSDWNPELLNSVYAITKYGAEMEVWRGTQEGLNAVIVNPGVIIGPGFFDNGSGLLFTKINKGFRYYTTGTTGYVAVDDVVQIMCKLMIGEHTNERYIVVGENLSYKTIFTMIAKALQKPVPTKKVGPLVLHIVYYVQKIKYIFGSRPTVFKASIRSAFSISTYENKKIKSELIYSFTPIEKAVQHTATFFLNRS